MPDRVVHRSKMAQLEATVAIVISLATSAGTYVVASRQSSSGKQAKEGICALRGGLEDQIASSYKYIADVKTGRRKPIPHVSISDIQVSIARQQKTVSALSFVTCN